MKRIAVLLLCIILSASAFAGLEEGQAAFDKKDYETALKEWEPLAEQGDKYAQRMMGMIYLLGLKVKHDDKKSFFWYDKAAQQGDADSQAHVGLAYQRGDGVARDDDLAMQWYRKAAAQGHSLAKYNLDLMLASANAARCKKTATTTLFDMPLRCASRAEFRTAVKSAGNKVTREDNNYWVDNYKSDAVLEGSEDLAVGYTRDGRFAAAEYTIPAGMDTSKVVEIRDMVASKYGKPNSSIGTPAVGEVEYKWKLKDGIEVLVWRGWPDATVHLTYREPENYAVWEDEIKKADLASQKEKQDKQKSAF